MLYYREGFFYDQSRVVFRAFPLLSLLRLAWMAVNSSMIARFNFVIGGSLSMNFLKFGSSCLMALVAQNSVFTSTQMVPRAALCEPCVVRPGRGAGTDPVHRL